MANFAEITLTNTNLTGETNFFTIKVKECSSPSFITVQTGLTYADFPYLVNLDETIGEITCYEYNVSETLTNLVCSGVTYIGTPSVTPSSTPTTTPSVTTSVTGVTVTPSSTPTTTPSVTTSVTGVTVTPSLTPSNTVTPTVTSTPSVTPTPDACYNYNVYTASTFNDVCESNNQITIYSNSSTLTNGSIVTLQNCINYSGIPLDDDIYFKLSGDSFYFTTYNGDGSIILAGYCPSPTPTPTSTSTPTPTITVTPSSTPFPTPSSTPATGVTVDIGAVYESGSTIANYTLTASTRVSTDTRIDFKNILYDNLNNEIPISTGVTINRGRVTGSTKVTLTSVDYKNIKGYQTSFSAITTSGENVKSVNKYSKVDFLDKSADNLVNWIFTGCCVSDGQIEIRVPFEATVPNGWVYLGWGVIYNDRCYMASQPGGSGVDGQFYGPDAKSCSPIYGCQTCQDSYKIALKSCCDGTLTTIYADLQTPLSPGQFIANINNGVCYEVVDMGPIENGQVTISESFTGCTECFNSDPSLGCVTPTPTQTPSNTPSVTPSITPSITPSVTPSLQYCPDGLDCIVSANTDCELSCYTGLVPYVAKRIIKCCNQSYAIPAMVPQSIETSTIIYWNNDCWIIGGDTDENENYVLSFTEYDTCNECVGCNDISPCELSWITCNVDPCCDGAPQLPQGSITFEGTACVGDGIIINGICYTISDIVEGQGVGSLEVTQDDIIESICNDPQCSCTVTLRACADVLGLGDIHYFPNFIRVNSWTITDNYSIGDILQFDTNLLTGNDQLGYSYPENIKVCYTVVENDDTVELNTQFTYDDNLGQQNCEDLYTESDSKCYIFVGLRPCHGIQSAQNSVIIFIQPSQNIWSTLSPGDTISSVELLGNTYISQGYVGVGATPCYTILEPGTEITLPQVQAGSVFNTDPLLDPVPVLQPDCLQDICSECFNGIVVTNTNEVSENPVTIQYYACSPTPPYQYIETQIISYGNSVTLSCINLASLYMINHPAIANQDITINYSSMNNC
jgi:hypothetical protein